MAQLQQATRVLPTAEQLLYRLDWQVLRRLDGLLQGEHRTHFYGAGVDFADLREYQPDDDARYIDWNVTARMNTAYVREFLEDRELTAWMLLDRSSSMSMGPEGRPKGLVLAEVVTVLARLLTRSGNRVGAVFFNNAVEALIPPAGGRRQVLRIAQGLLTQPPATKAATDLAGLVQMGLRTIRRRSLVFLVSDFLTAPGWERLLPALARRHDVVALRVWDPLEERIPDSGLIVLQDSETGEQMLVDTSDPALRRRVEELARSRDAALTATLRRAGVDTFAISTEDDIVTALISIVARRRRVIP